MDLRSEQKPVATIFTNTVPKLNMFPSKKTTFSTTHYNFAFGKPFLYWFLRSWSQILLSNLFHNFLHHLFSSKRHFPYHFTKTKEWNRDLLQRSGVEIALEFNLKKGLEENLDEFISVSGGGRFFRTVMKGWWSSWFCCFLKVKLKKIK